jgi:hypothetical protein
VSLHRCGILFREAEKSRNNTENKSCQAQTLMVKPENIFEGRIYSKKAG